MPIGVAKPDAQVCGMDILCLFDLMLWMPYGCPTSLVLNVVFGFDVCSFDGHIC